MQVILSVYMILFKGSVNTKDQQSKQGLTGNISTDQQLNSGFKVFSITLLIDKLSDIETKKDFLCMKTVLT